MCSTTSAMASSGMSTSPLFSTSNDEVAVGEDVPNGAELLLAVLGEHLEADLDGGQLLSRSRSVEHARDHEGSARSDDALITPVDVSIDVRHALADSLNVGSRLDPVGKLRGTCEIDR